jgi:hypothetical protein
LIERLLRTPVSPQAGLPQLGIGTMLATWHQTAFSILSSAAAAQLAGGRIFFSKICDGKQQLSIKSHQ